MSRTNQNRRPGLLSQLRQRAALRRGNRALLDLSHHLLKDIGLTEREARSRSEGPVWDVPRNWRR